MSELKRHQEQLEKVYHELSGLRGEALRLYTTYREEMEEFSNDLEKFFVERFGLVKGRQYQKHQPRGSRLERGWQRNILGTKGKKIVIHPNSFERKTMPNKPQFAWTIIIDNSLSCAGVIIEQEKKAAVSLITVAEKLGIPFEVVTFGEKGGAFLKTFEQEANESLQNIVLLTADQGTPDVAALSMAAQSMRNFTERFRDSHNFVYFMTDGESGGSSGTIQGVLEEYKRDMVITGIGLAGAASTIKKTWGDSAVEVPEIDKLSDEFFDKIKDQIEQTFG